LLGRLEQRVEFVLEFCGLQFEVGSVEPQVSFILLFVEYLHRLKQHIDSLEQAELAEKADVVSRSFVFSRSFAFQVRAQMGYAATILLVPDLLRRDSPVDVALKEEAARCEKEVNQRKV
jgi:hypothetical protein